MTEPLLVHNCGDQCGNLFFLFFFYFWSGGARFPFCTYYYPGLSGGNLRSFIPIRAILLTNLTEEDGFTETFINLIYSPYAPTLVLAAADFVPA